MQFIPKLNMNVNNNNNILDKVALVIAVFIQDQIKSFLYV